MALVEFGKASTHKLWKYVLTDWEGDTYECPKCGFETITNEGTEPAFNYCPMCGKKMCIDEEKEVARKEKKKAYMREYQQKRRASKKVVRKMSSDKLSDEEAKARYICCPMCDRDTCNRRAEDCDVNLYFKNKKGGAENEQQSTFKTKRL